MEILLWNNDRFPACCLFIYFFFLFPKIIFNRQHLILNKQCREPRRAQRQFPARTFWMCPVWCVCSLLPYAEFSLHSESFSLPLSLFNASLRMDRSFIVLFLFHWKWPLNTNSRGHEVQNAGKTKKYEKHWCQKVINYQEVWWVWERCWWSGVWQVF